MQFVSEWHRHSVEHNKRKGKNTLVESSAVSLVCCSVFSGGSKRNHGKCSTEASSSTNNALNTMFVMRDRSQADLHLDSERAWNVFMLHARQLHSIRPFDHFSVGYTIIIGVQCMLSKCFYPLALHTHGTCTGL